jgi:hypothetical protein
MKGTIMLKRILLLTTMLVVTLNADVKTKVHEECRPYYEPMPRYAYSYVSVIDRFGHTPWYYNIKREHRKVVDLLDQANKSISDLEYEVEMLSRDVAYWKKRSEAKTSKEDRLEREVARKKMRDEIKFK